MRLVATEMVKTVFSYLVCMGANSMSKVLSPVIETEWNSERLPPTIATEGTGDALVVTVYGPQVTEAGFTVTGKV